MAYPLVKTRAIIKFPEEATRDKKQAPIQCLVMGYCVCPDENLQQLLAIVRLAPAYSGYMENDFFKSYIGMMVVHPDLLEQIPLFNVTLTYEQTRRLHTFMGSKIPLQSEICIYEDQLVMLYVVPGYDGFPEFKVISKTSGVEVTGIYDIFQQLEFPDMSLKFIGQVV